jgi:hypothetical protein
MVNGQYKDEIVWYQAYKPAGEGSQEVPFALVLSSQFQINMMNTFRRQIVHLDGTGGTNNYGFWMATLLVVDEYGNGPPVATLITSSEAAEVHSQLLMKMRDAVESKAPGGEKFDYQFIMIDKSPTETAAIRNACGCEKHLYCYFHFLQVGYIAVFVPLPFFQFE